LFDKSDNGNDGIIHGAVSTTGNIGEALDFNGTGDYVSLSSSSIKDNSAFSIGVWIKVVTGGVIYSEGYSENRNWAILLGSNAGSIRIIFKEKGVWKGETKGTTLINDGQWYYIVVAQTNKSYREIFVDGVLEGTNTTTIGDMSILDTYTIGALERTSVSSFFDGLIDDMKIYDYALSSDDILGLYRSTKGAISQ
ncbi:MAG: LamG domain-containing protein, partial [Thermodesulfobacteriota bacterium]|nr:LamG domain-containing protein [Thermodesulfobacteriota bacterium]